MKIEYITGDLVSSNEKIIAHGCNTQGVMNAGVGKAIRKAHPKAFTDYAEHHYVHGKLTLGSIIETIDEDRVILNLITQKYYGRDPNVRYVSYDAVTDVIERINSFGYGRVAFPKIGAGLANGNWKVIEAIIEEYSKFSPIVYII